VKGMIRTPQQIKVLLEPGAFLNEKILLDRPGLNYEGANKWHWDKKLPGEYRCIFLSWI
jgi:hypothetical protein